MSVVKSLFTAPSFEGVGCSARVTDQVVLEVVVPGGRQTINFPVTCLPAVEALLAYAAADDDVQGLIAANTPEPDPVVPDPETP